MLTSEEQESRLLFIYLNRQDFTWKNQSGFSCANRDKMQVSLSSMIMCLPGIILITTEGVLQPRQVLLVYSSIDLFSFLNCILKHFCKKFKRGNEEVIRI